MDTEIPSTHRPPFPRYRHVEQQAMAIAIRPRDLLLLKAIYDFPYCDAGQLSRLMPVGSINPQLRAYHDQRLFAWAQKHDVVTPAGQVRREILRRLQQLFHAAGGPYVQRHKVN
jgi:hypothetical protein